MQNLNAFMALRALTRALGSLNLESRFAAAQVIHFGRMRPFPGGLRVGIVHPTEIRSSWCELGSNPAPHGSVMHDTERSSRIGEVVL